MYPIIRLSKWINFSSGEELSFHKTIPINHQPIRSQLEQFLRKNFNLRLQEIYFNGIQINVWHPDLPSKEFLVDYSWNLGMASLEEKISGVWHLRCQNSDWHVILKEMEQLKKFRLKGYYVEFNGPQEFRLQCLDSMNQTVILYGKLEF